MRIYDYWSLVRVTDNNIKLMGFLMSNGLIIRRPRCPKCNCHRNMRLAKDTGQSTKHRFKCPCGTKRLSEMAPFLKISSFQSPVSWWSLSAGLLKSASPALFWWPLLAGARWASGIDTCMRDEAWYFLTTRTISLGELALLSRSMRVWWQSASRPTTWVTWSPNSGFSESMTPLPREVISS